MVPSGKYFPVLILLLSYVLTLTVDVKTDEAGLEKETPSNANAISDGALAINAGADTTARAITFLIFLLLDNPTCMDRVRSEIERVFTKGENVLDTSKYASLTYLEACMCVYSSGIVKKVEAL